MNIAIFASAFYPHTGGVEELCRQLAHEYQRRGMGVIVLTNRWPRDLPRFEEVEGIPVYRLAMRAAGESIKSKVTALSAGLIRRQMMGILRRFEPDILHVQCVSVNAAYALHAKRLLGVPLVVTLQGELTMDATQLFKRSEWARRTLRLAMERADGVTACSGQTLNEAERWLGRNLGHRGSVIYNGISPGDAEEAQAYHHPRPYILAIGRHVHQKGFDVLLRAMAQIENAGGLGHDLLLAGDGAEHLALRQLASELSLGARVMFLGRVDHAMASSLFAGCSFFVLPSRHEPFGIVNLEAMAAGKAIVATRVGGVPELVAEGQTGILVNGDDVPDLANGIRRLATDTILRSRLGAAGKAKSKDFTWAAIADKYIDIYRQTKKRTNRWECVEKF